MKKIIAVLCVAIMAFAFMGFGEKSSTASFTGVVTGITDGEALVTPNEGENIRKSGDLVSVGFADMKADGLTVGDTVKVSYTGDIMESYPLQVKTSAIEIVQDAQIIVDNAKSENSTDSQREKVDAENDLGDEVSISNNSDESNFVDWKTVLKESIGLDVITMLDEQTNTGSIKVNELAGVMVSGLFIEGYEWKVQISKPTLLEFVKQGSEKNVIGERQGFDFFAFKGLKKGETKINIQVTEKSTQKVVTDYEFITQVSHLDNSIKKAFLKETKRQGKPA